MYEITGQPNLKWNKEKVLTSQRINDCMTDIHDHWYSPCVSMSMNHNVWCAFVFVFSKPQPCNCTRVEGHTSQAHLSRRTETTICMWVADTVRTLLYAASLYATYRQPLSHHLIKKYILWSRSFCEFVLASL